MGVQVDVNENEVTATVQAMIVAGRTNITCVKQADGKWRISGSP